VWCVAATWEQVPSAPVTHGGGTEFSRWVERCALVIRPVGPDVAGPALVIATLLASAGAVVGVDTSRRRLLAVTPRK
jgi:hypothetical protein